MDNNKWFSSGLHFSCHQCNNCCRGSQPGWVYVNPRQNEQIAKFLSIDLLSFKRDFLITNEEGDTVLRLKPNGDCIFWDNGCTVYSARPRQCRTFPFWPENLKSRKQWDGLKRFCGGIDNGNYYSLSEIRSILKGSPTSTGKDGSFQ